MEHTLLDSILKYWQLIIFLAGWIFHAIWVYFQVADHNKRIEKLESERLIADGALNEIKEAMASMNVKLDLLIEEYKRRKS